MDHFLAVLHIPFTPIQLVPEHVTLTRYADHAYSKPRSSSLVGCGRCRRGFFMSKMEENLVVFCTHVSPVVWLILAVWLPLRY